MSKKMRKGRNLSSRARKRSDRAQDRAEEIADRTQTKVAKSKGQARVIQSRRKNWEDINKEVPQAAANKFAGLADEDDSAGDDGNDGKPAANAVKRSAFELDDEMGDAAPGPAADYIPLPEAVNEDDHDGIL